MKNKIYSSASYSSYLNEFSKKTLANITSKTLIKCEPYISDERFTVEETRLLFKLRTRMYPAKLNFKNKYKGSEFCVIEESNQHAVLP